jgi:hypothetical protein
LFDPCRSQALANGRENRLKEIRDLLVTVIPGDIGSHDGTMTALVNGSDDVRGQCGQAPLGLKYIEGLRNVVQRYRRCGSIDIKTILSLPPMPKFDWVKR